MFGVAPVPVANCPVVGLSSRSITIRWRAGQVFQQREALQSRERRKSFTLSDFVPHTVQCGLRSAMVGLVSNHVNFSLIATRCLGQPAVLDLGSAGSAVAGVPGGEADLGEVLQV